MTSVKQDTQVLLLDDDPHLRTALSQTFDLAGLSVQALASAEGLLEQVSRDWPGIIVSDIRMPGMDGFALLRQIKSFDPELPVLLITGHGDVPLAVEAMRSGAYDFLQKPFAREQLLDSIHRALELRRLVLENRSLRLELADRSELGARLLGPSKQIQHLRQQVGALAITNADVLVWGETGSGKEVVARALHSLSSRRDGPFVAINAGALAENLVESELFGHEVGAFTGANKRRIGKFEYANGGTIFLDEIESMSLDVQVKILRLLQERVVERMGSNEQLPLDIRVIAATKEDLREAADQGRFRADLYYRLNVAQLRIPALRERKDDILPLFQHFLDKACERNNLPLKEMTAQDRLELLAHTWPGNVRELQNAAERYALGLAITISSSAEESYTTKVGLSAQVEAFEKAMIAAELGKAHTSLRSVAEALGIPRKTLHDKLRKHNLVFAGSGENSPFSDV